MLPQHAASVIVHISAVERSGLRISRSRLSIQLRLSGFYPAAS